MLAVGPDVECSGDPITVILENYGDESLDARLPTFVEQRQLVQGIQDGNIASIALLMNTHEGLVAAAAHRFQEKASDAYELLRIGHAALLVAAWEFSPNSPQGFYDFAASRITERYKELFPENRAASEPLGERPMEGILSYMVALERQRPAPATPPIDRARPASTPEELTTLGLQVAQRLHMTDKAIGEQLDIDVREVRNRLAWLRRQTGIQDRTGIALAYYRQGLAYDIPQPAHSPEDFTEVQRVIGRHLDKTNAVIAQRLTTKQKRYTDRHVKQELRQMKALTGAQTRTELALMIEATALQPAAPGK